MTQYRALRELRYPTDPKIIERLVAGENIPIGQRHMKVVKVGAVAGDIPEASVPTLLEKGWIEEVRPARGGAARE